MTSVQPDRTSYRWLVITLYVSAGAYGWVRHYPVSTPQRFRKKQRQLSDAAAELKTTLETALVTIAEFESKWKRWKNGGGISQEPRVCDFDDGQPYIDLDLFRATNNDDVRWSNFQKVNFVTSPALGFLASGAAGVPDAFFASARIGCFKSWLTPNCFR